MTSIEAVARVTKPGRTAVDVERARSICPTPSLPWTTCLRWVPPPVPQFQLRHEGRFVACVDLAYPERKLAIEYDGLWHGGAGQLAGIDVGSTPS